MDGLSGDGLIDALRQVLGKLADGAAITVAGGVVTLDFGEVPAANVLVAQRLYLKAAACADMGEFPKATSLYRRVLELDPTRQDASRELAMMLLETGKPDDAVDTLLDVLKTDPSDPRALVILGNHHARQYRQRHSTELIRCACEVASDDATAHNSLGYLLFEEKLTDQAIAELNEDSRLDPKLANDYYGLSMIEMGAARWTRARTWRKTRLSSSRHDASTAGFVMPASKGPVAAATISSTRHPDPEPRPAGSASKRAGHRFRIRQR